MIRIAAYTSGDITVASSRLRSFYLFESSADYGVTVIRNLTLLQSLACDCIHLQKCYKPRHIAHALFFRLLGKQVFFDIDDQTRGIYTLAIIVLMGIASVVTTDTEARRAYCAKFVDERKIAVIQDVLDVNPGNAEKIVVRESSASAGSRGILWTGHPGNLGSVEELLCSIARHKNFHMIVATRLAGNDALYARYPDVKFIEWKLDVSLDPGIDVAYMILSHNTGFDPDAIYKSENKMVLAIASGLIPIVSRTPAYVALAEALDAERLIFDELGGIFKIMESLDPIWIRNFMLRAREYILARYLGKTIFLKFKSLLKQRQY